MSPIVFLLQDKPPTPPSEYIRPLSPSVADQYVGTFAAYAAAHAHPTLTSLIRAMCGKEPKEEPTYMTWRERCDLVILMFEFGIFAAASVPFASFLSTSRLNSITGRMPSDLCQGRCS